MSSEVQQAGDTSCRRARPGAWMWQHTSQASRQAATTARASPRLRAQAAPAAAAGGLLAAASIGVATPFPPLAVAGGLAVAIGVAAAVWARRSGRRAYPVTCGLAAAGWGAAAVTVASPAGLAGPLVAGTAALGVPHWRRHRPAFPDVAADRLAELEPAPEPEPEPNPTPWQIDRIQQHLTGRGQPWAGARADDLEPIPFGFRVTVTVPDGQTHDLLWDGKARQVLRSVFDVPSERINVEMLPGRPQNKGRLITLLEDPLRRGVSWQGPTLDGGVTDVGIYADGRPVRWTFWNPEKGANHGLIAGASGSGKSKLLSILMLTTLRCDWMLPWFLDGQQGASAPTLAHHVEHIGRGPVDSLQRLRELYVAMQARAEQMPYLPWTDKYGRTQHGVSKITPTRDMPLIVAFLDEAQATLALDQAPEFVKVLVEQGRKCAIAVVLITQVPSAGNLNSITGMREQLKAFNMVVFRLEEQFTSGMVNANALPVPPHQLPQTFDDGQDTSGLGFKPDARHVMMRTAFVPDDDEMDYAKQRVDTRLDHFTAYAVTRVASQPGPAAGGESPAAGQQPTPSLIGSAQARLADMLPAGAHTDN